MMSRRAKATFYFFASPFMYANGLFYYYFRSPRDGNVNVHLGPGQKSYIPGWINVDANAFSARCDLWVDLRNALPFRDGTVDAFYSHHVVEHLPDIVKHFREVYRCLKPGGVYRVGGPHADNAILKFTQGERSWFSGSFSRHSGIGIGELFNDFLLCKNEHLCILTLNFVTDVMSSIGFCDLSVCVPGKETRYKSIFEECLSYESEANAKYAHTLIVEARKPV